MREQRRELARIKKVDLTIEDHGVLIFEVEFHYDGGSVQGWPICIGGPSGTDFLRRVMDAVGVYSLSRLVGKSCWVTHTNSSIDKIEPLHQKDGEPFDFLAWQKKVNK